LRTDVATWATSRYDFIADISATAYLDRRRWWSAVEVGDLGALLGTEAKADAQVPSIMAEIRRTDCEEDHTNAEIAVTRSLGVALWNGGEYLPRYRADTHAPRFSSGRACYLPELFFGRACGNDNRSAVKDNFISNS